jgi:uncharacterized protein with HEPN domain
MHDRSPKLLEDVIDAGHFALSQIQGKTLDEYNRSRPLQYIIERSFEVLGEALIRLERTDPDTATQITSLRDIIDFRNRIAHGYDDIRNDVVWTILNDHLPLLITEASALLPEFSSPPEDLSAL